MRTRWTQAAVIVGLALAAVVLARIALSIASPGWRWAAMLLALIMFLAAIFILIFALYSGSGVDRLTKPFCKLRRPSRPTCGS
jgi:MFS family permease